MRRKGKGQGGDERRSNRKVGNKEMLARFWTHPPLQGCYWRTSLPSSRHWEI